ncbi:metallophosphoesterase family protein [Desulfocicer niacini]
MRIAVISDVHSNYNALCRVLEDMEKNHVDRIVSLGDNIGYGPDPCGVIALLQDKGISSTLGNHELALLDLDYRQRFRGVALKAIQQTQALLSRGDVDFITSLPFFLVERGARFVHGLPPDSVMGYLSRTSDQRLARIMALLDQEISFVGHTHLLGIVEMKNTVITRFYMGKKILFLDKACRYIINAGSVGQSRDEDDRAKYIIWDGGQGCIEPRYVRA